MKTAAARNFQMCQTKFNLMPWTDGRTKHGRGGTDGRNRTKREAGFGSGPGGIEENVTGRLVTQETDETKLQLI